MSKLVFDGQTHMITLSDDSGEALASWDAYNNVDSHATLRHLDNAVYTAQDTAAPFGHPADPNGPYGSFGIARFNVPGHVGIGVHSGRADAKRKPGPPHWTMGCIRTTDVAMKAISDEMKAEALKTVEVKNNTFPSPKAATLIRGTS